MPWRPCPRASRCVRRSLKSAGIVSRRAHARLRFKGGGKRGEATAENQLWVNTEPAQQTWGMLCRFQFVVTVLTPATTETEDPPTVSLAPQYTSQRLCHASGNTKFFADDDDFPQSFIDFAPS